MYTLRWARDAAAFYDRLPANQQQRMDAVMLRLATDPSTTPHVKRLSGDLAGLRSLRVGSWRIIFEVEVSGYIDLLVFDDRKDAYR